MNMTAINWNQVVRTLVHHLVIYIGIYSLTYLIDTSFTLWYAAALPVDSRIVRSLPSSPLVAILFLFAEIFYYKLFYREKYSQGQAMDFLLPLIIVFFSSLNFVLALLVWSMTFEPIQTTY